MQTEAKHPQRLSGILKRPAGLRSLLSNKSHSFTVRTEKMRKGKAREMKAPWLSRATALSQASWLSPSLQSQPENKQTNGAYFPASSGARRGQISGSRRQRGRGPQRSCARTNHQELARWLLCSRFSHREDTRSSSASAGIWRP